MSTPHYSLKAILSSICKTKTSNHTTSATKRTLLDKAPLGGLSSSKLKLFFFSLPFIEFALIFNPLVYGNIGIAQSIVFYIVMMSVIMVIIFFVSWKNNKSALALITPSWHEYFSDIDLKLVLSSGVSPYNDFFTDYARLLDKNLSETDLQLSLRKAFDKMKEDNKDLLEAIARDSGR